MKTVNDIYDVVIVGSGGAGLRAAISAAENKARTLVIAKGRIDRSGATLLAGANLSADIACDGASLAEMGITNANKDDTKELWFEDTVHEGFYLNNQELVEVFVNEAANCIRELVNWGMKVNGTEGKRGISVLGSAILDALFKRAKEVGVEYVEDTAFTDVVVEGGKVCGVVCVDIRSGDIRFIPAKAVVIATGGAHNLFLDNSGSTDCCGEGPGAALRAGAELMDMEMVSFCPTVIKEPKMYKGNIMPYILINFSFGSICNKYGKTFTDKYLSRGVEKLAFETEWDKLLLSYAMQCEMDNGYGNMFGGLYYILNLHPKELKKELYKQFPSFDRGINKDILDYILDDHALTIAPFAHYFEGGIRIDKSMSTKVQGLFAAGECSSGLFGANRISAATTEMLVEGKTAGVSAAAYAADVRDACSASNGVLESIEKQLVKPFDGKGNISPIDIRKKMQQAMMDALTVIRNSDKLKKSALEISRLINEELPNAGVRNNTRVYNKEWLEYIKLRNGLITASAMLQAADIRKESRGVHIREDYFYTDDEHFLKNIVIENTDLGYHMASPLMTRVSPDMHERKDYIAYLEDVITKLSGKE
jgi:succinate dehydrogenase/fumarate reductase flavoprotein subunit